MVVKRRNSMISNIKNTQVSIGLIKARKRLKLVKTRQYARLSMNSKGFMEAYFTREMLNRIQILQWQRQSKRTGKR